jgi:hypothetical protein
MCKKSKQGINRRGIRDSEEPIREFLLHLSGQRVNRALWRSDNLLRKIAVSVVELKEKGERVSILRRSGQYRNNLDMTLHLAMRRLMNKSGQA